MANFASQRGQILPLAALAAVVLIGAAGFAVDVGYHQYRQRVQQTATDSAALAAASELLAGNWRAAGQKDAQLNGFTDGSVSGSCTPSTTTTCVVVTNPPASPDPYTGNTSAAEVVITAPNPTFFESVSGTSNVYISTKAVALLVNENANTCLLTLLGGANFNNGGVNAPNCGLTFNGDTNFHGATVDAAAINCAGTCSSGNFTGASPTKTAPASDPCPAITYCAYLANNPPTCTSTPSVPNPKSGPVILQPGCYPSGISIHNKDVQFTCGLYVLKGTLSIMPTGQNGPSNVTQSCASPGGVTLYVDTGGAVTIKDENVNLAAPTSGDYSQYASGEQNALIYQKPGNASTVNVQSVSCTTCNINLSGMLYAPSANLNYNASAGSDSGNGVLVIVGSANLNGGFSNLLSAPGSGNIVIKTAVLGE